MEKNLLELLQVAFTFNNKEDIYSIKRVYKLAFGVDIGDISFDSSDEVMILRSYDSSDVTGYYSNTIVCYDIDDDVTYELVLDQDGGENCMVIGNGFII